MFQNRVDGLSLQQRLIPAKTKANGAGVNIEIERKNAPPIVLTETRDISLPSDVVMGIRPEDIVEPKLYSGASNQLQDAECMIEIVEPAGADTFVVTELGGTQVTARLNAETTATAGQNQHLAFDLNKVSYFAPDSGLCLN